ncbi:MAG: rod shape-determining protein MreC [Candidatus Omnitrophica bacterium]|nr:rod shape-determining protein MreC [Candidatus Omnitrophota bacterium]MDD5078807.1 rod shape-determining protein MreC [Candidatus Omnitrophota bacterium]
MFKAKNKSIILAVTGISFLVLLSSIIPSVRRPLLNVLAYPVSVFSAVGRELSGMVFYHRNMVQAQRLSAELDFLRKKVYDSAEVYQENKRLEELLSIKRSLDYKVIAARVIGRDPSNWSSSIIINKGLDSGIRKGFVCINFLGLAGRVVEVDSNYCKVMLLTDSSLSVSAIDQRSRQEGLVCGSLGGSLLMKYLPKDCDVKVGDPVLTSGLTDIYPKGILIGTVTDISREYSGLASFAVIKPAVNLSALEEVLVIIP